ncbi:MerR family transcriptional regulator [Curtobacterium sp. S6]|uniref:MerR family transcriptional regulator n=1 Tax=Curtobacterium sp. S6 TaxID=1479623 RepID=UPI0004ABA4EE|nr:MerR family transcriptional regulator [Curtobacterium sp. S6]
MVEWTVHQLADRAGVSPRTLRHYHQIGLLQPDRIGTNGYRYYGAAAVARLQRILLLRNTGITLQDIGTVLTNETDQGAEIDALEAQLTQLHRESAALKRRISAVEHTLAMRRDGRQPQMDMVLEGFNDRYEDEVTRRWGRDVFERSNRWWHGKSLDQQRKFQVDAEQLLERWGELHRQGVAPTDTEAQVHARKHATWFEQIPGTPAHTGDFTEPRAMLHGMANLYTTNTDFHPAFGGPESADFAAQAIHHYADLQYPD